MVDAEFRQFVDSITVGEGLQPLPRATAYRNMTTTSDARDYVSMDSDVPAPSPLARRLFNNCRHRRAAASVIVLIVIAIIGGCIAVATRHQHAPTNRVVPRSTTLTIDVGAPIVGSAVSAGMLGLNQGPHMEGSWFNREII